MQRSTAVRRFARRGTPGWEPPGAAKERDHFLGLAFGGLTVVSLGGPLLLGWLAPGMLHFLSGSGVGGLLFCGLVSTSALAARALAGRKIKAALRQLAREAERLPALQGLSDGDLVRVRGHVAQREGGPVPDGIVYERRIEDRIVHERAVDFAVASEMLGHVWVDVADARLLHPSGDQARLGAWTLRVGDEVEVLGWKARTADQRLVRFEREDPVRVVLRSGKALPLLVIPGDVRALPASASAKVLSPAEQKRLES